jgi:hypothetical protein
MQLMTRWHRAPDSAFVDALAPLGLPESPRDLERMTRRARNALVGSTRAILTTLAVAALHGVALRFIFLPIGAG